MLKKIKVFLNKDYFTKLEILKNNFFKMKSKLFYSLFFGEIGDRSLIKTPLRLTNVKNIFIGKKVIIGYSSWLLTMKTEKRVPKLIIEDGATIGNFNHITCIDEVVIGKNVLTADRVYISDNYHDYKSINIPILSQKVKSKKTAKIGEGSWVGENACIISCTIGKNCVIAANSVVTKDIPDYCIAGGVPAKVMKRYNTATESWEKTDENGGFLNEI